ncbi:Amylo-alpha-1,6-glucosidase [Ectothiorhodospira sp. PHS-1]|uniref:amylo-alpha-1,6-glucosidase n=1 Tax=Ectothiorhodospira sp. PHS-1 TaxID=519989 RepID=UPI00024A8A00|nr:amylo-alpha-1,6-glucosidase [Ectothiorhodospira sp. PHS-1]EHQ53671.1 Amylo-alpha-1,6-glucosidase [Ectothiorhodospira sp. PHS-1]
MTDDVIHYRGQWYVLATSSHADDRTRVLKSGETFALFDRHGDIHHFGTGDQGIFHEGTRYLSQLELLVNDQRPLLLNSTVTPDNLLLAVDLTTPDLLAEDDITIPKGTVHLLREKLLRNGIHYERLRIRHYGEERQTVELSYLFEADYADIFEVRGVRRDRRGELLPYELGKHEAVLGYHGVDSRVRRTRLRFSETPDVLEHNQARFRLELPPQEEITLELAISCEGETQPSGFVSLSAAYVEATAETQREADRAAAVVSSNEQFNDWLCRSAADLRMLISGTSRGAYPYAGVPWFSAPFGRDGIITALQYLWLDPEVARGVLGFLAATQADEDNAAQDAQPGKILHEARESEMALLGKVPFRRYYGSVDATPLFIVLAERYYRHTADRSFIAGLWPHIERALAWIDRYGDVDGDGFVEYHRESDDGLVNQGWKDSHDSVFHADGRDAAGPIALCEVQGYVYDARRSAARLARLLGKDELATRLDREANLLKERFNAAFWCPDLNTYALALDADKRRCEVISSNAGHTLYSGIADPNLARRLARTLLSETSYSGWGIRTIAQGQARFNPMSYHNGSVWPHDNALIAAGLARYGFKAEAIRLFTGMFDTALHMDLHRLPELFCGFQRLPGQGPTLYPVACSPQAWASGTVFMLLQACLGMEFDAEQQLLSFDHPQLPEYLANLRISRLKVGDAVLDLTFQRHPKDVGVNVVEKRGEASVVVRV